ncbi:THUMP-like domain-containing protein [Bifidobacterium scaligerum]|uniref:SAM-dependent methyltransferase n=1 Tax=Bifidobacterium scaligerum TaxID=2052656 RepID=A0A2M9HTR7_9BIFI|nr:SAM-dependent methyltransferase [Bifidobacterium scaligerum]PJM80192.1 SAM-dependent methyltransferase [Bifidobacterium scaligerum]
MEINEQTWTFIAEHRHDDVRELALHAKPDAAVDVPFALEQISGWQRACVKLPNWAARDRLIYPPQVPMEQCSSQFTARYKAQLASRLMEEIRHAPIGMDAPGTPIEAQITGAETNPDWSNSFGDLSPTTLVDLTGGFGVDCSYMAPVFDNAVYVERQSNLCEIARHNLPLLGLGSTRIVNKDSIEVLNRIDSASMFFLDPARRDSHGSRTYAIADCTPDVLALKSQLLAKAPLVMVKLSPMLDWHKTVADFAGSVHEVHIVSVGNECKDLLLVLKRGICNKPRVVCVNDDQALEYRAMNDETIDVGSRGQHEQETIADVPKASYLYEPNASIMKAGCFDVIEQRFPVSMIAPNSHLFVGRQRVDDFPGRSFAITAVGSLNKKELKHTISGLTHANIAVRNFPMSVAALRKKLKLKDGGDAYLFATTDAYGHHIIIATRKA